MRNCSIRPLAEAMFFKRAISEVKNENISKKLLWKIFLVASVMNPNYKGREADGHYAKISAVNFYKLIYGHYYDYKKKDHRRRLRKIEQSLEILSTPYNSIRQKNIIFFNKYQISGTTYYQYSGRKNIEWSKLSYSLPTFIKIPLNETNIKICDWDFAPMVLVSIFATAAKKLSWTYRQMEVMFGMSEYHVKKAAKKLGVQIINHADNTSWYERKGYEISETHLNKTKNKVIRGNFFRNTEVCEEFIKTQNIEIDWMMMFYLRMFIYNNLEFVTPEYFTKINDAVENKLNFYFKEGRKYINSRNFKEDHYNKMIPDGNADITNSCVNYKREMMVTPKDFSNEKTQHFKKIYSNGIQKPYERKYKIQWNEIKQNIKHNREQSSSFVEKYYSQKYDSTQKSPKRKLDRLAKSKTVANICQSQTFSDFATKTSKVYKKLQEKRKTVFCWKELKHAILEKLTIMDSNENIKLFKKKLLEINSTEDAFKSPIFTEQYSHYYEMPDYLVTNYIDVYESQFDKEKEMNPVDFYDRRIRLRTKLLENPDLDYETAKKSIFHDMEMSNNQKKILMEVKKEIEEERKRISIKKELEQQNESSVFEFMKEILEKEVFSCRNELIKYIERNLKKNVIGINRLFEEVIYCSSCDILKEISYEISENNENFELLEEMISIAESKKETNVCDLPKFETREKENNFVLSLKNKLGKS